MKAAPKILIIKLSSLGDILHTLPAFASLRAAFPDSRIEWLVSRKCAFLLNAVRGIDSIHILDTSSLMRLPVDRSAWNNLRKLIGELRSRRFDCVIDFQGLLKTALLARVAGAGTRIGFSREIVREWPAHWFYQRRLTRPVKPVHVLVLNRMLAELSGSTLPDAAIEFAVTDEDCGAANEHIQRSQLTDFIVLNPGGGWPTKRWSPQKYGMLAKEIGQKLGMKVAVTTGPGEESLYHAIADACGEPAPEHFPIPFLQMIPFLKRARLFVGGDTGPFHLACAVGTPVVGIFGPTSPVRNGPWKPGDVIVHHAMECSSCYGRGCSRGNECMNIAVDEVFEAIVRRMRVREDSSASH